MSALLDSQSQGQFLSTLRSKIAIIAQIAGANFLEQFDFFMFGLYAHQISVTFFPFQGGAGSLMLAFTVFGAGFLMRPLGAVVLGAYIDRAGRRKGLILTLSFMASGTALIAFVPGYGTLGMLAPLLVIIGRLLQGFSVGAEMGGVSVYLAEIATPGHRGFYSAWQSASLQVSIIVSAALGYGLSHGLSPQDLDDWGWRIPFLIGCSLIPCIFILRRRLAETDGPKTPDSREALRSLRQNWTIVLGGMLLGAMTTVTFNLIVIYTPTFGRAVLGLSGKDSLLVTLCIGLSNFIWLPIGGALSDRIGRKQVLAAASVLTLVCAYPVFAWLADAPSILRLLSVLLVFSFCYGIYNGAMVAALTEVMPTNIRVMGFSLAFSLATAVFGGVTLPFSTYLIALTGDKAAPGYWMSVAALCSLAATLWLYRRRG